MLRIDLWFIGTIFFFGDMRTQILGDAILFPVLFFHTAEMFASLHFIESSRGERIDSKY